MQRDHVLSSLPLLYCIRNIKDILAMIIRDYIVLRLHTQESAMVFLSSLVYTEMMPFQKMKIEMIFIELNKILLAEIRSRIQYVSECHTLGYK